MDEITLNIKAPQIHPATGKAVIRLDSKTFQDLNPKTQDNIEKNFDKLEKITLGNTINALFDSVMLPSKAVFALYSEVSLKIRKAIQELQPFIKMSREDAETLKRIFQDHPPQDPRLNSQFAFVIMELDKTLEQKVIAK